MRSVFVAIAWAFLLVGLLAWNAQAAPLAWTSGFQSATYSLIVKARCDDSEPRDKTCRGNQTVECTNQPGAADCTCVDCSALVTSTEQEPTAGDPLGTCTCRANTCCNPGTGKWCCR